VQGACGSRQTRAQVRRGRRNDRGDPNKASSQKYTILVFSPTPSQLALFRRYTHRLTPVTNTCVANVPEIKSLAQRILKPFLAQHSDSDSRVRPTPANSKKGNITDIDLLSHAPQYKIELRVRNHNSVPRPTIIDTIVSCVPSGWVVNLDEAEVFILVEVFKVRVFRISARVTV
jgi:hypothetical protein